MRIIFAIIFLLIHNLLFGSRQSEYILNINKEDLYKVTVKAKFNSEADMLSIHPACSSYSYTKGYSTFIKPLSENCSYSSTVYYDSIIYITKN